MSLEAQGYEIIGASTFGPEPLSGIHLDIRSGSTMLYGKNGTGKTRLLDELTYAFQGVGQPKKASRPRPLIHISVEVRPSSGDNNFVLALYEMLDVSKELQSEDEHREHFQSALMERVNNWADLELKDAMDVLDYPELKTSEGFHLSLMPSGTLIDPRWTVYLSAILGVEDLHKLAQHGAAHSGINRVMVEGPSDWGDLPAAKLGISLSAVSSPFGLAQAHEWYTEPFDIIRGGATAAPKYVPTNSSPVDAWPAHIPVPLLSIGIISKGPAQVFVNSMPLDVIQQRTLSRVSRTQWNAPIVEPSAGSEIELADSVQKAVTLAQTESNRILDLLADFPFQLRFDTGTPSDWFAGRPPKWVAVPRRGEANKIPLDDLSFSEQKWVRFALSLFLSESDRGKPRVVIVDEPEQGLHRQRETLIALGLHKLVAEFNDVAIIGATHSPAFLDPRHGSNLLHLSLTGSGKTMMTALEIGAGRQTLDEESKRLGVAPSDLLAMTRVALVVEGTHDQIVLEECLSEDMLKSGARVFVMRGTDNAAALPDMQFLFDALDAPIVVVVDNVVHLRIKPIWERAVDAFQAENPRLAGRILRELQPKTATKEERALAELGLRAIRVGRLSRIRPFGLGQHDILDYLSPKHFNLDAADWQSYQTAFGARKRSGESFKPFMRREYSAEFNEATVVKAAKAIGTIPEDFTRLGGLIRQLGYLGAIDDLEVSAD